MVSLRICEDHDNDDIESRPCLGIILHYANGRQEALGQIRHDKYLSQETDMEKSEFRMSYVGKILYVFYKEASTASSSIGEAWINLPRSGTLVWWFGTQGNMLHLVKDDERIRL